jgi:phage-related protein
MKVRCLDCGHSEEVDADFFVKIIGGATAGFGFWAWVSFLFAGTGFAMVICIAIIGGGAAMLAYKNEIVDWIVNKDYPCVKCGGKKWAAASPEMEKEINLREAKISTLTRESANLMRDHAAREKEAFAFIQAKDSTFSLNEVQEILDQNENQKATIVALQKDREEWNKHIEPLRAAQEKMVRNLEKTFSALYSSLSFTDNALKRISKLKESERLKLEPQFGFLQHNPKNAKFRDDIEGTDVKELEFGDGGRFYVRKEGSRFVVVCVGNKNSQNTDLKHLKQAYKRS